MRLSIFIFTLSMLVFGFAHAGIIETKIASDADSKVRTAMFNQVKALQLAARQGRAPAEHRIFFPKNQLLQKADWSGDYAASYPNGDVYYLAGNIDSQMTQAEFTRYYQIAKWLGREGFRPILNPIAYISDVREAVSNPHTAVIIWSSHGDTNGYVYDSANAPLPEDIFRTPHRPVSRSWY